jgi:hypothetical protein
MKRNQQANPKPKDTPATRKRRLQQRLRELSDRSEQEMANIVKSVEKLKSTFRSNKS